MFKFLIAVVLIVGLVSCEKKPSGRVFFVSPQNGEEVRSPVAFKMGLEGMEIQPAGEVLPGKGHHHIIINGDPLASGQAVPFVEKKTPRKGKYTRCKKKLLLNLSRGNMMLLSNLQMVHMFHTDLNFLLKFVSRLFREFDFKKEILDF